MKQGNERKMTGALTVQEQVEIFRENIEKVYLDAPTSCGGSFGEILCYELHSQPVNPRLPGDTGLTFEELAGKWGITLPFLGALIKDHCEKL